MIRVALFGAETILMVWHPRLPVPLPLLALDGGSILVLERTPKYRTLNTPNIECLNIKLSKHHILAQNRTLNMSNITKTRTVHEH